jgi:hypothetical protein
MRATGDRNILDRFCTDFCDIVQRHCKYIVVSGFVAISSGRTRATEDIDMIIEKLNLARFKALHSDLAKAGFTCMQSDSPEEVYSYLAEEKASVRYTLRDHPLPEMEVKFAKDELDSMQLQTRVKLPLTGLDIWFSSISMNIAFKEELLKSDKDLKDAEHLRKIYPELVSEDEIKHIKKMILRLRL